MLIEQLLESVRRVKYVEVIRTLKLSNRRADPNDDLFDPLKAAILVSASAEYTRCKVEHGLWTFSQPAATRNGGGYSVMARPVPKLGPLEIDHKSAA